VLGGRFTSKPTWSNASGRSSTSAFFVVVANSATVWTVADVVFPTGSDRRDDLGMPDRLDVYYGMACLASKRENEDIK
jgi:hypothetical protein